MKKRIELEKRGRNPAAITELNLDNCRSTQIIGLTDEYCNLETLSLMNVGLITLKGFPKLPNLTKLELSDNRISGGLNWLYGSPKLIHLKLSGNKIKDIETLKPLQEFKNLKNLDLFNCEVTSVENYRDEVFGLISSLKYLDGYDRDDKEAEDSEVDDEDDSKKKIYDQLLEPNDSKENEKELLQDNTDEQDDDDDVNVDDEEDKDDDVKSTELKCRIRRPWMSMRLRKTLLQAVEKKKKIEKSRGMNMAKMEDETEIEWMSRLYEERFQIAKECGFFSEPFEAF